MGTNRHPGVPTAEVKSLRDQGFKNGIQFCLEVIGHRIPMYSFPEPLEQLQIYLRGILQSGKPKRP